MPLLDGPSLGGNARHVLRQYAEENALALGRGTNAAGTEEFGGGCLRGRYNNLREVIQNNPSLVVVPSIINAGSLFVQRPICRTNYLPNNSMAGATGGVLPTNWSIASLPAGITVSYSASGTAVAADGTSVNYIDITVSGTAGASGFLNLRPLASPSTVSAVSGQTWTTSVYLSLVSGSVSGLSANWALQETTSGGGFLTQSLIQASGITSSLERYNVSRTLTEATAALVQVRWGHSFVSGTAYSYTIRIGSPQLERFSVPTPMIATSTGAVTRLNESTDVVGLPPDFTVSRNTTATRVNSSGLIESVASGVPRIDWLGQSCPALLVEASGQNGILNSTDTTTNWTCWSGFTSGVIDVLGVSGVNLQVNTSGSNIGAGTGNGNIARTNNNVALASGSTYTLSFFIKKTGAHTIGGYYASITGAASGDLGGGFNVSGSFSSGSIYNTAGTTNRIRRVEQWGTDVYRCSETFTMTASGTLTTFRLAPVSGVTLASLAAVGTELGFAAPQIELGAFPTSFIPTTSGAGSRAADVISASGALVSGLIGQTEGTIYVEVDIRLFGNLGVFATISDGTTSNRLDIYKFTNSKIYFDRISATQSALTSVQSSATYTAPTILKIAVGYKSGDSQMYINGVAATAQQTPTFTFGTLTKVNIGSSGTNINQLNDRIRAAALYTTRLSNDQLAELTRL